MQKEALLFHPQLDVWTDHFAWTEDATEITGLTPTGRATIARIVVGGEVPYPEGSFFGTGIGSTRVQYRDIAISESCRS